MFAESTDAVRSIRRAARVLGLVSVFVILLFFIGEGFNPSEVAARQWAGLLFFPLGVVAGMIIGWRRELTGGAITLTSLAGFYLIYGLILRRQRRSGLGIHRLFAAGAAVPAVWIAGSWPEQTGR